MAVLELVDLGEALVVHQRLVDIAPRSAGRFLVWLSLLLLFTGGILVCLENEDLILQSPYLSARILDDLLDSRFTLLG